MEAWEVKRAARVGVAEPWGAYVGVPAAAHGNDGAGGDWTVLLDPGFEIVRSQLGVRVSRSFGADVDDHERADELGSRDAIGRVMIRFVEWGIKVCAGMLVDVPAVGVPAFGVESGCGFHLKLDLPTERGKGWIQSVCEIDHVGVSDSLGRSRKRCGDSGCRGDDAEAGGREEIAPGYPTRHCVEA